MIETGEMVTGRTTHFIKDLPESMLNEVRQEIRFFSVVLLISDGDDSNVIPASGTLCRIDNQYGIVTARHVWDDDRSGIKRHSDLKIVIGQRTQHMKTEYLTSIGPSISGEKYSISVPDITFIRIPSEIHSTIEANRKLFYPLDMSLREYGNDLFDELDGVWCTFGSPIKRINIANRHAPSVIYASSIPKKVEEGNWDYLELNIISETGQMPADARGMSGGGIWRTRFLSDFSQYKVIFSGVNFYQTKISRNYKVIGHGPQSVYKNLLPLVKNESLESSS